MIIRLFEHVSGSIKNMFRQNPLSHTLLAQNTNHARKWNIESMKDKTVVVCFDKVKMIGSHQQRFLRCLVLHCVIPRVKIGNVQSLLRLNCRFKLHRERLQQAHVLDVSIGDKFQ